MPPAVTMTNVTKSFGRTVAVNGVSFEVRPGRVDALMGENGAGKSTLMKMLAGVYRPDAGHMAIAGQPVSFANPREALANGISTVFQELSLLPNLSIAENMFLGKEPLGFLGIPDRGPRAIARPAPNAMIRSPRPSPCGCGGTGRRARLKIWFPQGSGGSSPSTRTIDFRVSRTNGGLARPPGFAFPPVMAFASPQASSRRRPVR